MDKLTKRQFLKYLRDALNHLQDPGYLRHSPLATLFGVADRFDTPVALRRILTKAIESLEPAADKPSESRAWRIYESVFYRYVEEFSQQDVAHQLGISTRQLRREQRAALEALACLLWEKFDLGTEARKGIEVETTAQILETEPAINEELAWLKNTPPETSADPSQTLPATVNLIRPLAAQHGVCLEIAMPDALPRLAVDPVALRQILLDLLSVAISQASSGGQVHLSAKSLLYEVEIRVQCEAVSSGPRLASDDEETKLRMACRLTSLCGGRLTLSSGEKTFAATLILPALEQLPVLAIDDNTGALQLLQRYTTNTRYRLIGARDPEQALSLAEKVSPRLIVLDVMMPRVDGWEVLGRLRQHPLTAHIPVIVCTILTQEELAFSLGASAFIRKPVTRQAFLAVLDQQIEQMGPESR